VLGLITWLGILVMQRGVGSPVLQYLRRRQIGEQRGDVILPQRQIAAGKILGGGHRTQYIPGGRRRKWLSCRRRVFDAAPSSNRCIVVDGDPPRGEIPRT